MQKYANICKHMQTYVKLSKKSAKICIWVVCAVLCFSCSLEILLCSPGCMLWVHLASRLHDWKAASMYSSVDSTPSKLETQRHQATVNHTTAHHICICICICMEMHRSTLVCIYIYIQTQWSPVRYSMCFQNQENKGSHRGNVLDVFYMSCKIMLKSHKLMQKSYKHNIKS